ncbi:MAG: flippase-like domain-containing protein [Magnetococcales bacterium]|nr:flippase-like domain-containing protein [Magnetococcales bacterium]
MPWLKKFLPVVLSGLLLYLVFRDVDPVRFGTALQNLHLEMLALALLLITSHLGWKYFRWRMLLEVLAPGIPRWPVFSGMCVGILVDQILPGRVGELARSHLVGRAAGLSRTAVLGTVVVERILDLGSVLLVSLLALGALGMDNDLIRRTLAGGGILLGGLLVLLGLFLFFRPTCYRLLHRLLPERFGKPLVGLLEKLSSGFLVMGRWRNALVALAATLVMWVCIVGGYAGMLLAVDFPTPPPLHTAFVLLPLIVVGVAIPSVPAGTGIFEYVAFLALQITLPAAALATMNAEIALFALLFHLVQIAPEWLAGLYCLHREYRGLSLGAALERIKGIRDPAPGETTP